MNLKENVNVTIEVRRDSGETSRYQVPFSKGISALWTMRYIYENLDSSLAFPLCLCRIGKCGNCAIRLNGKPVLACSAILRDPEATYLIEPLSDERIIRDLVMGEA